VYNRLKYDVHPDNISKLIRTSKKTRRVSITKATQLMQFREIIAVYSEITLIIEC
jgi:hypothetical protein